MRSCSECLDTLTTMLSACNRGVLVLSSSTALEQLIAKHWEAGLPHSGVISCHCLVLLIDAALHVQRPACICAAGQPAMARPGRLVLMLMRSGWAVSRGVTTSCVGAGQPAPSVSTLTSCCQQTDALSHMRCSTQRSLHRATIRQSVSDIKRFDYLAASESSGCAHLHRTVPA